VCATRGLYSGGATPGLLTGVAERESSYYQFISRSLYGVPNGLWPNENAANSKTPAGLYVGLMQVPNGMVDAFDYLTNTYQGWYIFNGNLSVAGGADIGILMSAISEAERG